jgi:hypothetical protein
MVNWSACVFFGQVIGDHFAMGEWIEVTPLCFSGKKQILQPQAA